MRTVPVPPRSLSRALDYIRAGGRLVVRTQTRTTVLDRKVLLRFESARAPLLEEEGDGYRLHSGRSSVYLLPGQLEAVED